MNFDKVLINELIALRNALHQYPEISEKEFLTSDKLAGFVASSQPDELIRNLGGTGFAAVFKGEIPGKALLFRAELDALPINETNDFEYKSAFPGISHKCGHDGHAAILAGLSRILHQNPIKSGKVILLFQPAEETGKGAPSILNDPKFSAQKVDHVFALHNLPGFRKNAVVIRNQHFAAASKGMIIRLTGKTSHAANPEQGISPALALSEIIRKFSDLSTTQDGFKSFKLITIIHARLGEVAFGTSPGYAEVMATLRSFRNDDMELLTIMAYRIVEALADKYDLQEKIEWTEAFPASVNDDKCVDLVREVADENKLPIHEVEIPFRWSEDFGHFLSRFPGALFGIGAGRNHASLHNPDYDFPDELIKTGIAMFYGIIRKLQEMK